MARPLPETALLTAFAALHDCRSFTKAAQEAGVTQSALSHRIRKLEDFLGYRLFERTTTRVSPTPAGEALFAELQPILAGLEKLFQSESRRPAEVLQVEMESSFARNWLTPRLGRFTARHPGISIDLRIRNEGFQFAKGTSLAVRWGNGNWPGYRAEWLVGMDFTPACSVGFLQNHPLNSPADLLSCPLLHDRSTAHWQQWLRLAGLDPRPATEGHILHDTALLEHSVARGQGVALLSPLILPEDTGPAQMRLVLPFGGITLRPEEGYHILRTGERLRGAAASFALWLKSEIALSENRDPGDPADLPAT